MRLSALADSKDLVDWWFVYKISGSGAVESSAKGISGTTYISFDSSTSPTGSLAPSKCTANKSCWLSNSLNQLYVEKGASKQHTGWFFYNDEDPTAKTGNLGKSRGHTQGVVALDVASDTALWLVKSTPNRPPVDNYAFPKSSMPNAQTLLRLTVKEANTSLHLTRQMCAAQQPNVYFASTIPVDLATKPPDQCSLLMQNKTADGTTLGAAAAPFLSKAGVKFTCMAKNTHSVLDFYYAFVGPTLHENLDVETWIHGKMPPAPDGDKIHTVSDMAGINLMGLGLNVHWPENDDHAKSCISAGSEQTDCVSVGDINFAISIKKRGGGKIAYQCEPLWRSLSPILTGVTAQLPPGSKTEKLQRRTAEANANGAVYARHRWLRPISAESAYFKNSTRVG